MIDTLDLHMQIGILRDKIQFSTNRVLHQLNKYDILSLLTEDGYNWKRTILLDDNEQHIELINIIKEDF